MNIMVCCDVMNVRVLVGGSAQSIVVPLQCKLL